MYYLLLYCTVVIQNRSWKQTSQIRKMNQALFIPLCLFNFLSGITCLTTNANLLDRVLEEIQLNFGPLSICTLIKHPNWPAENFTSSESNEITAGSINGFQIPSNDSLKRSNCIVALTRPNNVPNFRLCASRKSPPLWSTSEVHPRGQLDNRCR